MKTTARLGWLTTLLLISQAAAAVDPAPIPTRAHTVRIAAAQATMPKQEVIAAEPLVIEIWPGKVPDESGDIGPERVRMSPRLDRKHVNQGTDKVFD